MCYTDRFFSLSIALIQLKQSLCFTINIQTSVLSEKSLIDYIYGLSMDKLFLSSCQPGSCACINLVYLLVTPGSCKDGSRGYLP